MTSTKLGLSIATPVDLFLLDGWLLTTEGVCMWSTLCKDNELPQCSSQLDRISCATSDLTFNPFGVKALKSKR